jgi:hypothetical protein
MKSSASALIGAVLVGWVGSPAVAFPKPDITASARLRTCASGACVDAKAAQDRSATCDAHTHSSACGCARCSAARNE